MNYYNNDNKLYFCFNCYYDILLSFENTVEIETRRNAVCDSYSDTLHVGLPHFISELTAKVKKDSKWKFSNDSRRKIIGMRNNSSAKYALCPFVSILLIISYFC